MRKLFLTGLIMLLPTLMTIFIIVLALKFMINNIGRPLGSGIFSFLGLVSGIEFSHWKIYPGMASLTGLVLAVMIIFLVGYLMATFLGRYIIKAIENQFLKKFPIIKAIYPSAKQFTEMLFTGDKKAAFKMVVAVQYPRAGLYLLAFVTSDGMPALNAAVGQECISIFIPTSPTPFTGFTIFVPRADVIPLKLSVDEALRTIVSGGILIPAHQLTKLKPARTCPTVSFRRACPTGRRACPNDHSVGQEKGGD